MAEPSAQKCDALVAQCQRVLADWKFDQHVNRATPPQGGGGGGGQPYGDAAFAAKGKGKGKKGKKRKRARVRITIISMHWRTTARADCPIVVKILMICMTSQVVPLIIDKRLMTKHCKMHISVLNRTLKTGS